MQNPVVVASNGAICCKLWPNPFCGWGPQIWVVSPCLGATPKPRANPVAPGATPKLQGQPLCLGATPLPLGQPQSPWGDPYAPGATLKPWGNPKATGTPPGTPGTKDKGQGQGTRDHWTMGPGTMGPGTWDLGPGPWDLGPRTRDQGPGTQTSSKIGLRLSRSVKV